MNELDNMKQMMLLVESADQLDEIDFKKAAATAMAVGALAGSPDVDASNYDNINTDNQPVATQSASSMSASEILDKYDGGRFFGTVNGLMHLEDSPEGKVYRELQQLLFNGYMEQIGKMPPEQKTGNMKMKAKELAETRAMVMMARYLTDTNPDHPFIIKR